MAHLKTLAMAATGLALVMGAPAIAHDHSKPEKKAAHGPLLSFDQLSQTFGWKMDETKITIQKISDGFYVLFGVGGNIGVSVGKDGTLVVDDQFPQMMPKIQKALASIGSKGVDFVVNTHWHFDHAEGNLALGKTGSWIVSHSNSRKKMLSDNVINFGPFAYKQKAYPEHALSDISFDRSMQFHFNGEQVDLIHFGAAHTNGDAAVIFRGKNAVHMGDVFNNAGFPFIDADNGGDLEGMIAFCQAVYDSIDDKTIVIPGHGPITDRAKLLRYIEVLSAVRDRVRPMVDKGDDLATIIAAKPTAEYDKEMYATDLSLPSFLSRVYASMIKKKK